MRCGSFTLAQVLIAPISAQTRTYFSPGATGHLAFPLPKPPFSGCFYPRSLSRNPFTSFLVNLPAWPHPCSSPTIPKSATVNLVQLKAGQVFSPSILPGPAHSLQEPMLSLPDSSCQELAWGSRGSLWGAYCLGGRIPVCEATVPQKHLLHPKHRPKECVRPSPGSWQETQTADLTHLWD